MVARLTVPDSTWVIVTSAPATGWPSAPVTRPPTPADVLCANAGAAASATISPSDSLENRRREWFMVWLASMQWTELRGSAQACGTRMLGDPHPAQASSLPSGVNNRL